MAKKAAPRKKKASSTQVLNTALFIGAITQIEGTDRIFGGKTYAAGTPVSPGMKDAYDKGAALIGGTTPFENFCTEGAATPIEIAPPTETESE